MPSPRTVIKLRNTQPVNVSEGLSLTFAANIGLLSILLVGVLFYIMTANAITSSRYKVSSLNQELSTIQQENSDFLTSKMEAEDSTAVLVFAQNHNMVEARTVAHVFESGDVALGR